MIILVQALEQPFGREALAIKPKSLLRKKGEEDVFAERTASKLSKKYPVKRLEKDWSQKKKKDPRKTDIKSSLKFDQGFSLILK